MFEDEENGEDWYNELRELYLKGFIDGLHGREPFPSNNEVINWLNGQVDFKYDLNKTGKLWTGI